jgi:hypothetical protein
MSQKATKGLLVLPPEMNYNQTALSPVMFVVGIPHTLFSKRKYLGGISEVHL